MKLLTRIKIKTLVFLSIFMSFSMVSLSQIQDSKNDDNDFWQHVRFGGGIGLSFGDGFFSGTLAPSAIYQFNSDVALGLGLNGTYNSLKNTYSSTVFGASIISLFSPIPEIQLSGEFEELNVSRKYENNLSVDENYWYPALFLGVGYRSNNVTFGVRYDVLYDRNKSIYADPWAPFVRVFF